jgi:hypothetical protein
MRSLFDLCGFIAATLLVFSPLWVPLALGFALVVVML